MRPKTKLDSHIEEKIRNVTKAAVELQKVAGSKGRVAIRTARRSLWARIQALKEECDAQFVLPKRKSDLPPMTLAEKARRYQTNTFLREITKDAQANCVSYLVTYTLDEYQAYTAAVADELHVEPPLVLTGVGEDDNYFGRSKFDFAKFEIGKDWLDPISIPTVGASIAWHTALYAAGRNPKLTRGNTKFNKWILTAWEIFKSQEWRIT